MIKEINGCTILELGDSKYDDQDSRACNNKARYSPHLALGQRSERPVSCNHVCEIVETSGQWNRYEEEEGHVQPSCQCSWTFEAMQVGIPQAIEFEYMEYHHPNWIRVKPRENQPQITSSSSNTWPKSGKAEVTKIQVYVWLGPETIDPHWLNQTC